MPDNNSKRLHVSPDVRHKDAIERSIEKQNSPKFSKSKVAQWLADSDVKAFNKILLEKAFMKHIGLTDSDVLISEISDYFKVCYDYGMVPTMSSMAVWLGVNIDTIYATIAKNGTNAEILKQAVNICHMQNENGAISGSINSVLYMFLSKNYYGMHDNSTINLTTGMQDTTINNENTMKVIQEQIALENTSKTDLNMSNSDETS